MGRKGGEGQWNDITLTKVMFTRSEIQVAEAVLRHDVHKEAAKAIGKKHRTLDNHVLNMYRKTGLRRHRFWVWYKMEWSPAHREDIDKALRGRKR